MQCKKVSENKHEKVKNLRILKFEEMFVFVEIKGISLFVGREEIAV